MDHPYTADGDAGADGADACDPPLRSCSSPQ
jgi:hypothetical protein